MSDHILSAKTRAEKGRKTQVLRAQGLVPAIVYGDAIQPQTLTLDRNQFAKIYQAAGESSVVELKIDEKDALHVLIQDYQVDPLRHEYTHIDFRSIDMNKKIETEVDLEFVGESAAVKAGGGTLVLSRETIEIRCLPIKLVRSIQVDISTLATFDDVIRVTDLTIPEGIEVMEEDDLSIAVVQAPRSEAEMDALNAAVEEDVSSVQVAHEKKEEESATDEEKSAKEST